MKHIHTFESFLNEETGYERHESLNESVTEKEIDSAIKLMEPAAKAAGFQLRKVNTKPGKKLTSHAVWTVAGEEYRNTTSGPLQRAVYLLWAKPHGLYVSVSQQGTFPVSGKPQDWTDKLKWAKAFE
jgi:hypothetical protein